MTNNFAQVKAWATAHPLTPHQEPWEGFCEMFVADAGAFTNSFDTATLELQAASKVYSESQLDIVRVPAGWLLHWAYVGNDGTDYGHVAYSDGLGRALMASSYITARVNASHSLGYVPSRDYARLSGHHYLGASPDHGGEYLSGIRRTPAAANPTPSVYHVKAGDTLSSIAAAHHTTWQKLYALNLHVIGRDPNVLVVPETLRLP